MPDLPGVEAVRRYLLSLSTVGRVPASAPHASYSAAWYNSHVDTVAKKVRSLLLVFLTGRKYRRSSSPAHPEPVEGHERDLLHSYGSLRQAQGKLGSPRAEQ